MRGTLYCAMHDNIFFVPYNSTLDQIQFSVRDHIQIVASLPFAVLIILLPLLSQLSFLNLIFLQSSFLSVLFLQHPCIDFQMGSYIPPLCVLVGSLQWIFRVCCDGKRVRRGILLHHMPWPICLLTLLHLLLLLPLLLIAVLDSQTTGIRPIIPLPFPIHPATTPNHIATTGSLATWLRSILMS